MIQENKWLLLEYLSMALLYKVKVTTTNPAAEFGVISGISIENKISVRTKHADIVFDCTEVKPYLRSMSSMTEEEKKEFNNIPSTKNYQIVNGDLPWDVANYKQIQWLLKKHFDFMGLIPKGLAIEVKENNLYKN
jgi:hypothetical protein